MVLGLDCLNPEKTVQKKWKRGKGGKGEGNARGERKTLKRRTFPSICVRDTCINRPMKRAPESRRVVDFATLLTSAGLARHFVDFGGAVAYASTACTSRACSRLCYTAVR